MAKKQTNKIAGQPEFEILRLEKFAGGKKCPQTAHRHERYSIFFIQRGSAQHMINEIMYELAPKRIQFIGPGEMHEWKTVGNCEGYAIFFTEEFFKSSKTLLHSIFFKSAGSPAHLDLDDKSSVAVFNMLNSMEEKFISGEHFMHNIMRSYLNVLFFEIVCYYEKIMARKR